MSKSLNLAYGEQPIAFHVPNQADILTPKDPEPVITQKLFKQRLTAFIEKNDLDLTSVVAVVADKTRLCGYPTYLPILVQTLQNYGLKTDRLKFIIAYGTHPRQSDVESRNAYGEIFGQFQWLHHDCSDRSSFEDQGHTRKGTPVRMRTDIKAASCIITFGAISHHYFAGYGGGRKLIFPGLGEKSAIYANHGLFLDRTTRRLAEKCRCGVLAQNPLSEDLAEVETHRPADIAIHGILDSRGRVCDLMVGCGQDHFINACRRHGTHYEIPGRQYDLVVASCSGFPKDINFIQSHKTIHNAAAFVRDNGRLIVLAQCKDGIGSQTFLPWFRMGGWEAAFNQLAEHYEGNGGTALAMMEKLQRIEIDLVTQLDQTIADTVGFKCLTAPQAQQIIDATTGRIAVIPNAALLVHKVQEL